MCFVDIEKASNRVPRKVMEWAMRKKGLPEVIIRRIIHFIHAYELMLGLHVFRQTGPPRRVDSWPHHLSAT